MIGYTLLLLSAVYVAIFAEGYLDVKLKVDPNPVLLGGELSLTAVLPADVAAGDVRRYTFIRPDGRRRTLRTTNSLKISRARKSYEGEWKVTVRIGYETITSDPVYVTIQEPTVTVTLQVNPNPVPYKQKITLTAEVPEEKKGLIKYYFFITPDGKKIRRQTNVLEISQALRKHEGKWKVLVKGDNIRPTTSNAVDVQLLAPTIDVKLIIEPSPVALDGKVILTAQVPADKVQLIKRYIFTRPDGSRVTRRNNILEIDGVRKKHAGKWTVTVTVGDDFDAQTSDPVELHVELKGFQTPTVHLTITPDNIQVSGQVILKAEVSGSTVVAKYIFISPDGIKIEHHENQIQIPAAVMKDSGEWTVSVETELGTVTSDPGNLEVYPLPKDFTIGCDQRPYQINYLPKTFAKAQDHCEAQGLTLAVPGDKIEMKAIASEIDTSQGLSPYMTGIVYKNNEFLNTICNGSKLSISVVGATGSSVAISGERMSRVSPDEEMPFLCQERKCDDLFDVKYNGQKYTTIMRPRSRDQADEYCKDIGGQLMTIDVMPEMAAVCEKLLELRLATTAFWSSPLAPLGEQVYSDPCGNPIPQPIILSGAFNDIEYGSYAGQRCTVLLDDIYYVRKCDDCNPFICEMPGCTPN